MTRGEPGTSRISPPTSSLEVGQVRRPQAAVPARIQQEAQQGADLELPPALLRLVLPPGAGCVGVMDVDRDVGLSPKAFREADVIGVAVGDQQGADVGDGPTHSPQLRHELVPLAGDAGVDHGHATGVFDEVGSDDVVADPVQRGGELHGVTPGSAIDMAGSSRATCA